MEGGIVFTTASDKAVYIPAGCIHAVYTLGGGFLFSLDFTTKDSVVPFGNYLSKFLHLALDEEGRRSYLFAYVDSTKIALFNGRHSEAIDSWLALASLLQTTASQDPLWLRTALSCWEKFFESSEWISLACPCGLEQGVERFASHMKEDHLHYLFATEYSGNRRSRMHIRT
jgi:hypothetical protein